MANETSLKQIPLEKCFEDPQQPRQTHSPGEHRRLLASIMKIGQLVPGHVQRTDDGRYRIDAGARRFRALQAAREKCPEDPRFQHFLALCAGDVDERRRIVIQWASNAFRADIAPIDKARFIARIAEDLGGDMRADLGLSENDWRLCRQVASAPDWLQKFGSPQRYDVAERDGNGVVQMVEQGQPRKKTMERVALPLANIVRLLRHFNKLNKHLIESKGRTQGEALTYQEVHRLAHTAQREEWSKRQLDDACNRSWERTNNGDPVATRQKFTNDEKQLRVSWAQLREMSQQELEELEVALASALERVRLTVAAKAAQEPAEPEDELLSA